MSFHLVEMISKQPDLLVWMRKTPADHKEIIAELHRENPGTSRDDEMEILAQSLGWLF